MGGGGGNNKVNRDMQIRVLLAPNLNENLMEQSLPAPDGFATANQSEA